MIFRTFSGNKISGNIYSLALSISYFYMRIIATRCSRNSSFYCEAFIRHFTSSH